MVIVGYSCFLLFVCWLVGWPVCLFEGPWLEGLADGIGEGRQLQGQASNAILPNSSKEYPNIHWTILTYIQYIHMCTSNIYIYTHFPNYIHINHMIYIYIYTLYIMISVDLEILNSSCQHSGYQNPTGAFLGLHTRTLLHKSLGGRLKRRKVLINLETHQRSKIHYDYKI